MRTLEACSGPWIGWWIQQGFRGHQRLQLSFSNGRIVGDGGDDSGKFNISGEYEADEVNLQKHYPLWSVNYLGRWDGTILSGHWTISSPDFFDAGTFEIWPEEPEKHAIESEEFAQARA